MYMLHDDDLSILFINANSDYRHNNCSPNKTLEEHMHIILFVRSINVLPSKILLFQLQKRSPYHHFTSPHVKRGFA
jgi:hypothetical protein